MLLLVMMALSGISSKTINSHRWKIIRITCASDTLIYPVAHHVLLYPGGDYSFPDFKVNQCQGRYAFIEADSVHFLPATCTEACCNSEEEKGLMRFFVNAGHYKKNGQSLLITADLNYKWVIDEYVGGTKTFSGLTRMELMQVD